MAKSMSEDRPMVGLQPQDGIQRGPAYFGSGCLIRALNFKPYYNMQWVASMLSYRGMEEKVGLPFLQSNLHHIKTIAL
jgi:hypothetical protein